VTFSRLCLPLLYHPAPEFARFFSAFTNYRKRIPALQSAKCKLFPSSQKQEFCIEHFKKVHFQAVFLHFLLTFQKEIL